MYDYGTESFYVTASATGDTGTITIPMVMYIIVSLCITIVSIVALWRIFKKAGKPGWASIIPIYNLVVMFQICDMSPWLILLNLIPFVNFVLSPILSIVMNAKLAGKFGKGVGFALGLIFFNFIFTLILAFGDSEYEG